MYEKILILALGIIIGYNIIRILFKYTRIPKIILLLVYILIYIYFPFEFSVLKEDYIKEDNVKEDNVKEVEWFYTGETNWYDRNNNEFVILIGNTPDKYGRQFLEQGGNNKFICKVEKIGTGYYDEYSDSIYNVYNVYDCKIEYPIYRNKFYLPKSYRCVWDVLVSLKCNERIVHEIKSENHTTERGQNR